MRSALRYGAAAFAIMVFSALASLNAFAVTPNPVLIFMGQEPITMGGKNVTRYNYSVFNSPDIPDSLFAAAPALPPCGNNTSAARSWVDIFDQANNRLNRFCSLGKSSDLNGIWFALDEGVLPPSWIFIEINDRQTNTKFKSNLAETTL